MIVRRFAACLLMLALGPPPRPPHSRPGGACLASKACANPLIGYGRSWA
jgi:hypothetical protein